MPFDFGITDEGVSVPRTIDYLDAFDAAYLGDPNGGIDLDSTNPDNARDVLVRINGYVAAMMGRLGGQVQAIRDIIDPESASGRQLVSLARIRGVNAIRATYSQVGISITGAAGAQFGTGQVTVRGGGRNGVEATWTLAEDVTLSSEGLGSAVFRSDEPGAIPGPAGQVASLVTPVAGIDTVTNLLDAAVGLDEESDGALRIRMRTGGSASAGCGIPGIRSRIAALEDSNATAFIQQCAIYANGDSQPRSFGGLTLEAHSYLVVVVPNQLTTEQQQLVLGVLYDSVVGTAKSVGTDVSGEVVNLVDGTSWPVSFDYYDGVTLSIALGGLTARSGLSAADARAAVGREILGLLPLALGEGVTLLDICGAVRDSGAATSITPSQILLNGVNDDYTPLPIELVESLTLTINGVVVDLEDL